MGGFRNNQRLKPRHIFIRSNRWACCAAPASCTGSCGARRWPQMGADAGPMLSLASTCRFGQLTPGRRRAELWFFSAGCALPGCTAGHEAVALWAGVGGTGPLGAGGSAHLRGATTCPGDGLGKGGAVRLAPEGGWEYLPTRRAGWHMGSSLVPPRDPQTQAPPSPPPRARRLDLCRVCLRQLGRARISCSRARRARR